MFDLLQLSNEAVELLHNLLLELFNLHTFFRGVAYVDLECAREQPQQQQLYFLVLSFSSILPGEKSETALPKVALESVQWFNSYQLWFREEETLVQLQSPSCHSIE